MSHAGRNTDYLSTTYLGSFVLLSGRRSQLVAYVRIRIWQ